MTTPHPGPQADADALDAVYRKITRKLIPLLFLCYVFNYVDRANIGFAQLQMKGALGFSDAVYGLAAGIFFVGYVLFEVPSNLLLKRIGARATLLRIMVLWGLTSAATMFVSTPGQFYLARFLLGVFEAGFFPGIVLYLTFWYPPERRARMVAVFMLAAVASGIITGPVSGWVLQHMDGLNGWRGWQWMFLVEGLPSAMLGLVVYALLADGPATARWLSADEKRLVQQALQAAPGPAADPAAGPAHGSLRPVLTDPQVYGLCWVAFTVLSGAYFLSFWIPTMIRDLGITDLQQVGLYSVLPNFVAAVVVLLYGRHSDRTQERRWHFAGAALAGALGLLATSLTTQSLWGTLLALTLAGCGIISAIPVFWAIATERLGPQRAAVGIAFITSVSSLSGIVSPAVIGLIKAQTGSLQPGLYLMAGLLVAGTWVLLQGLTREPPR